MITFWEVPLLEALLVVALGTVGLAAGGVLIGVLGLMLGFGRAAVIALTGGKP